MKKWEDGFFTNGVFLLGDERESEANGFFRHSGELAKFIDEILDKYDDHYLYIIRAIFIDILEILNE